MANQAKSVTTYHVTNQRKKHKDFHNPTSCFNAEKMKKRVILANTIAHDSVFMLDVLISTINI